MNPPRALHPSLAALDRWLATDQQWAELWLSRSHQGFEIRHRADRLLDPAALRETAPSEARTLARLTHRGDYRPLKAAPTLVRGWRIAVADVTDLAEVLHGFYPGSVADWWAAQADAPPTTDYASFTLRQTGMYRSAAGLAPERVAEVVSACCSEASCLKRRLWTAPRVGPDAPEAKSVVPCLEPCAVLLELARVAAKLDQQPKSSLLLTAAELETLGHALECALRDPGGTGRDAEVTSPTNARRLRLLLARFQTMVPAETKPPR